MFIRGNGTAQILANDSTAFTLSIHGVKNFPLRKTPSDLDVALEDGTVDQPYLQALDESLKSVAENGPFDLAIYVAGADPFAGDRLGRLALTKNGLEHRDQRVIKWCQDHGIPLAIAMGGGYARRINDIVDIHVSTVRMASKKRHAFQL